MIPDEGQIVQKLQEYILKKNMFSQTLTFIKSRRGYLEHNTTPE